MYLTFHLLSVCLDKYAVRFIPRENGLYLIDVKFNGSHIPGSPFKIRVGETGQAGDPGMVSAYGPGLEGGTTGNTLLLLFFSLTVSFPVLLKLTFISIISSILPILSFLSRNCL